MDSMMSLAAWIMVGVSVVCLVVAAIIVGLVETRHMGLPFRRRLPF